jgi:hypothetical protein
MTIAERELLDPVAMRPRFRLFKAAVDGIALLRRAGGRAYTIN